MDKEIIKNILMKAGINIIYETEDYIQIDNACNSEEVIDFDFDKNGNLKDVECY